MSAALALAVGSCADEDDDRAIEAFAQPGERGSMVWALADRPTSLDPLFADSPAEQLVTRQIHEPLVAALVGPFDQTRRVPGLALSARPSSDATVWRLRLRRVLGALRPAAGTTPQR